MKARDAQVEKDISTGLQRRRAFTTSLLQSLLSLLSKSRVRHGALLKRLEALSAGEAGAALQAELKRLQASQAVATKSAEAVPPFPRPLCLLSALTPLMRAPVL